MEHSTVFYKEGVYAGWPANNGAWIWEGNEIVVGFTAGRYRQSRGLHNIAGPITNYQARSIDGGVTWRFERPEINVKDGDFFELPFPVDFRDTTFGMKALGATYRGHNYQRGGFFVTSDKGQIWRGPFRMSGLLSARELRGMTITSRTDYLAYSSQRCLLMLSAQREDFGDRVFCARTADGGRTFEFVCWVTPPDEPARAVMPSTARLPEGDLISAVRRSVIAEKRSICWIDAYLSTDSGQSWKLLDKIGDTGHYNGNPPALILMRDGRLCCVYGRRDRYRLVARISSDQGRSWGAEWVLREDFPRQNRPDFGYPRVVQRMDGALVIIYYWATRSLPEQHIAATVWSPPTT